MAYQTRVLPGSFQPNWDPSNQLWLRADLGTTIVTGVGTWADQSGKGNNVTQATGADQPTITLSGIGGKPSLTFNGTSQFLTFTGFSITSPLTIFAVAQFQAIGNIEMAYSFGEGGAGYLDSSTDDEGQGFNFNGAQINTVTPSPGAAFVGTGLVNGTTSSFYCNNGTVTTDLLHNGTVSQLFIGSFGASDFNGKYVSEVMMFNKAMSFIEMQQVWGYLKARYNINGAPAFNPTLIPGCALWLRADLGITMGTGVATWADQSGNGNNFTQGTGVIQPGYSVSGGPNGTAMLTFNGLQFLTDAATLGVSASAWTVFIVSQFNNGGTEDISFSMGNTTNGIGFGALPSSVRFVGVGGVATMADGTATTGWEGWTITNTGSLNTMRVNGSVVSLSNNTSQTPSIVATNSVGSWSGIDNWNGNIAEVIVYTSALSAVQITAVENYLQARYGVA